MADKRSPFREFQPQPPRPPMVALDRFGKMIEAGHLILFHNEEDLIFEVVSVGPALNPMIQGGQAIQVVLQAKFPVVFQPAMPNRKMAICGETRAKTEAAAGKNGQPQTSGLVLTDAPTDPIMDDGGPGSEGAPRDLGDTEPPTED